MKGYAEDIFPCKTRWSRWAPTIGHYEPRPNVISVVVAPDFPDKTKIRDVLQNGVLHEPSDTVWVVRAAREREAGKVAITALHEVGVEAIIAIPNTEFWGKNAGNWRDNELLSCSRLCIVFHDGKSGVSGYFADKEYSPVPIKVIEVMAPKVTAPRKPTKRKTALEREQGV